MQVLLVEDDDRVGAAITDVLCHHGFSVRRARTAAEALARLDADVGVVVLDLGLPDRDGFELCTRIRRHTDVPVIIATARGDLASRVHGLHLGADDYLVKPFDVRELMARIHAVTRRGRTGGTVPEQAAPALVVDPESRLVTLDGRPVPLTRKEFDLLALLASHPGVVFRREQILSAVWESRWSGGFRTLEVHVASVRSKTGRPGLIETVRGVGYRLATDPVDG